MKDLGFVGGSRGFARSSDGCIHFRFFVDLALEIAVLEQL